MKAIQKMIANAQTNTTQPANVQSTTTVKEIEGISKRMRDTKLKIRELLLPILVITVLILIIIFVFIPMINTANELRAELKEVKEKEEQLTKLKDTLSKMDEGEFDTDLMDVKAVIPKSLKVSSFIYYIDDLAQQMNLESEAISAVDMKVISGSEIKTTEENKGVNGPLSYSGSLEDILSFLDSFYTSSPYIVSPKNINLEGKSGDKWEVSLNLTGYYIDDVEITRFDIYRPFKPYTSYTSEMEALREKASRLRSGN